MRDFEKLKQEKRDRDKAWKESHQYEGQLDRDGYTSLETGEHISLRNASPLGVGVTGVEGSGNVSVYDKSTDTHHTVIPGTGNQSNSQAFIDNHNKILKSHVMEDFGPPPSIAELKQQAENVERRSQETAERGKGGYSGVYLSGDV